MQKKNSRKKPAIKLKDLRASNDPKGGGKKHIANIKYADVKRS